MLISPPLIFVVVGVVVTLIAMEFWGRVSKDWAWLLQSAEYTRKQLNAAARALRRGNFTAEDPVTRILMVEFARYYSASGVANLVPTIFMFAGIGTALSALYFWGSMVAVGIVVQVLLAIGLVSTTVDKVREIRNSKKFLAP
jgi:uncharacterized membrane protein